MNGSSATNEASGRSLDVTEWQNETCDGQETRFLCVYCERFGFGMSFRQVQQAVAKLDAILTHGTMPETDGEMQIDRCGIDDRSVMVAFRPAANHAGRYFDFPEDTAKCLLERLRERLR
jgi:hypothetical protein